MKMTNLKARVIALLAIAFSASVQAGPQTELDWQIKTNAEVYGFNVYRSTERVGPFVRVNDDLVREGGNPGPSESLQSFQFVDTAVESGKTYYYYVDVVKTSGSSERLTGTLAKSIP